MNDILRQMASAFNDSINQVLKKRYPEYDPSLISSIPYESVIIMLYDGNPFAQVSKKNGHVTEIM